MIDAVVEDVRSGALHRDNISFEGLRQSFANADEDVRRTLDRGRALLESPTQLDAYLYWYGRMTRLQWGAFFEHVDIPPGRLQVIDYACGQGLACVLLFDHFGRGLVDQIDRVVLIEPSATALRRAQAIVSCYLGRGGEIRCINKMLDGVTAEDLEMQEGRTTIHLFSNVLDIEGFDTYSLFGKMLRTRGLHHVLAVSHHRYHNGGSSRIEDLAKALTEPNNWDGDVRLRSDCAWFFLSDGKPAISWELVAEVLHDSI